MISTESELIELKGEWVKWIKFHRNKESDTYKEPLRGQFAQNLFLLGSQKLQRLVLIVPSFNLIQSKTLKKGFNYGF